VITEKEVKEKTDDELLEIWKNQITYVPEMVAWTEAEIKKRNLDTTSIHVLAEKELDESARVSSAIGLVRFAAITQWLSVIFLVLIAGAGYRDFSWIEATLLALALLLIVLSAGVWARKQWAFTIGTIVYALITAFNISIMIEVLLRVVTSAPGVFEPQAIDPIGFAFSIVRVIYTGAVALAFNALRKQSWHAEGERLAGARSA
jgi:lysylphosphatidylglycerol synthetase-like protein (DUF2156 family)